MPKNWIPKLLGGLKSLFPSDGFASAAFKLGQGTAISCLLAAVSSPVLTRIYSVQEFGRFQIYLSLVGMGISVITLKYELAVLLPRGKRTGWSVVVLCLTCALLFSTAIWMVLAAARALEAPIGRFANLGPWILLVPLAMLLAGSWQSINAMAIREKAYGQSAVSKVTQMASQVGGQTILGWLAKSYVPGLVLGDLFGRLMGVGRLLYWAAQWRGSLLRSITRHRMAKVACKYKRFPLYLATSGLINAATISMPLIWFAHFYGEKVVGWLSLVERTVGLGTAIVGYSVSQVYMSELTHKMRLKTSGIAHVFGKLVKMLAMIALPPAVVILLFGPRIYGLIFGSDWVVAGEYARLLLPMHLVGFIAWPMISTLSLMEQQSWQFAWDLGRFITLSSAILWMCHSGWPVENVLLIYSAIMCLFYAIHLMASKHLIDGVES